MQPMPLTVEILHKEVTSSKKKGPSENAKSSNVEPRSMVQEVNDVGNPLW